MGRYSLRHSRRLFLVGMFLGAPCWLGAQESSLRASNDKPKGDVIVTEYFASPSISGETVSLSPVPSGAIAPIVAVTIPTRNARPAHSFWDRQNRILFAVDGALAGADFYTTRRNLGQNGKELNPVANLFASNAPALASNFALETGGVIGISYLFHKTGHHKLERFTSYVNIAGSISAVSYNVSHH
jgi:hypothetical protein